MQIKYKNKISEMVYTSLLIAIVFISTYLIKIQTGNGYIHLGDASIFISVIVLGRKGGMLASSLGMMIADIVSGYIIYAPFTFIIKGIMAYIISFGIHKENKKKIVVYSLSIIFMITAYYFAEIIILVIGGSETYPAIIGAMVTIIPNIIQGIVGISIALSVEKFFNFRKTNE